ncbi:MAG: glycosyltransferase [Candidatus Thermoplasmatota archaeon]|nr:glycosyltransferase [Candidatus Thermoplasmatota archaeon]
MKPKISAIICTLNRAKYLEKAINSLINQTIDPEFYEIIIVDNGSTDNTKNLVENLRNNEQLCYIYEPIRGLSQARNTGWQNARGEYIAFLDDDGLATVNWLEEIINTFEKTSPSPDACGGKIELIWETNRPSWIADSMLKPLGYFDYGDKSFSLDSGNQNIGGGNMAFKKNIPELIGYFNTNLGRKGSNLLSNDENDFFSRMRKKGLKLCYNPKIVALHHVTKNRTEKNWFLKRYYWQGKSNSILDLGKDDITKNNVLSKIITNLYNLLKILIFRGYLIIVNYSNEQKLFKNKCDIMSKLGYMIQCIEIFKNKLINKVV